MKLSFHGAAQTVTGSKHLITLNDGSRILLDCGMFQGMGARTQALNEQFGFEASSISVVLLSHAHIDHSGLIPKLVAEGFTGKIYCTQPTRELTEILLYDSASIQAQAGDGDQGPPCFGPEDVAKAMTQFENIAYDQWTEVFPGVSALYTTTGHLVGGAAIHLKIIENGRQTTISYSADVGRARHALLKPATPFPQADYIILESTYGDKRHNPLVNNIDTLLQHIRHTCLQQQGKLIIPAFSVGRTQEILFMLNQLELEKRLPPLKYFVDSPLSMKSTETIKRHVEEFNDRLQNILKVDDDPFAFEGLKYVETTDDSIRLTEYQEPCVIISSSGTADAGRVRHHIRHAIGDARNTILFSGYCGPDSLGGHLLKHPRTITIFETVHDVRARIDKMEGLSAHGDADDLCQFVACQDPAYVRSLFLVHGEHKAQEALAGRLANKGFYPVHIPALHESFELNLAFRQGMTG